MLESANRFSIDGMEWHFLVADASGRQAVIELIDGRVVVHEKELLSIPLLCNDPYGKEVDNWRTMSASAKTSDSAQWNRFSRGADRFVATSEQGATIERALALLDSLRQDPGTQWTYIVELQQKRVRYTTVTAPGWRELTWSDVDFSRGPTLAWNIDEADKERWFQAVTPESSRAMADRAVAMFLMLVGPHKLESHLASIGASSRMLRRQLGRADHWLDPNESPAATNCAGRDGTPRVRFDNSESSRRRLRDNHDLLTQPRVRRIRMRAIMPDHAHLVGWNGQGWGEDLQIDPHLHTRHRFAYDAATHPWRRNARTDECISGCDDVEGGLEFAPDGKRLVYLNAGTRSGDRSGLAAGCRFHRRRWLPSG